jgi:hypothetical protein
VDPAFDIAMLGGGDLLVNSDGQPQFFHDLSGQTGLEALVRLPLAAGELPEVTQVGKAMALGDQDPALPDDEASRYLNCRHNLSH